MFSMNRRRLFATAALTGLVPWLAHAQAGSTTEEVGPDGSTLTALTAVLAKLQTAVAAGDAGGVAALVSFPVPVNFASGRKQRMSRKQFMTRFAEIFTPKLRAAVAKQKPAGLFRNSQGAMIGDGEVWLSGICIDAKCTGSQILVTAINVP